MEEDFQIKVITTDESLKVLGELLGNESSRNMIKILIEYDMYTEKLKFAQWKQAKLREIK